MSLGSIGKHKPHIQRAQPYDGDGWICWGGTGNGETQFGSTPVRAYKHWELAQFAPSAATFYSLSDALRRQA